MKDGIHTNGYTVTNKQTNADRIRSMADRNTCCGNYEQETAEMMEKAFAESKIYDPDKVLDRLWDESFERFGCDTGMGGELVANGIDVE